MSPRLPRGFVRCARCTNITSGGLNEGGECWACEAHLGEPDLMDAGSRARPHGRPTIKALTVQQPWAWAIVHGSKDVENRSQAWSYRGPLAIHAGLAQPAKDNLASRTHRAAHGSETPTELVFGVVIGVVDLVEIHVAQGRCCQSEWGESPQERLGKLVHLALEHPRPLAQPIPCRGALGLWTPPADVLAQLGEAIGA